MFSFDDFYSIVMEYHPVVQQARLLPEQAMQELRMARGAFDPKVETLWSKKSYNDTEYYNIFKSALKIPVWLPLDPEVGIEQNTGAYLNPERYISESTDHRQVYGGISVPVGRGLFIDERRATVQKAALFKDMSEVEQIKLINKLLLSAANDYWEWYDAYNQYILAEQAIEIAQDIFDRTRLAFEYGEVAAIDTVQAGISLQKRFIEFQQADADRVTTALKLSNHLWAEGGLPLELRDDVAPEAIAVIATSAFELEALVEQARNNHPELRKLELKNDMLQVDQRLARENLKPTLDIGYYLLDQPFNANGERQAFSLTDNYKIGLQFSFPLLLRKERAKVNHTSLKILDNNYERSYREREIINEINALYTSLLNTSEIIGRQRQMVEGYERIVDAERMNLENGESDLFKINVQLDKLIEARSKYIKLNTKYKKNEAYLYWAAGMAVVN
ncbi:hypothetical protein C900_02638 [Fulvivirga imtechensis AK7]|uniref:Outer membrane efflux protein n=1 Tax=Fulvivirga imtechensis AK7 TaxID=1237149 RepID=L8JZG7_9BACT|nr:hypothetical protein C900_02638 [Fulvivirga imtechensis AK7]